MRAWVFVIFALLGLAACEQRSAEAPPPPPAEEKDSVQLKLDTENGAVEFKKEGEGDDLNVEVDGKK